MSKTRESNLQARLHHIQNRIYHQLHSKDTVLNELLGYALKTKGKQLRVRLTLLSGQLCGSIGPTTDAMAASLELFHYATLMHDDVIDKARQRRHGLSMNARYGNEIAVLAGDFLFTQVMKILYAEVPKSVQAYVVGASEKVCLGEIQERQYRRKVTMTIAQYREVIGNKTASLFATCCQGGAATAGGTKKQIGKLEAFGRAYGMAFQIQDDVLDLVGDPGKTGKPAGQDLREGRLTLPVILGISRLRGEARKKLCSAVKTGKFRLASIQKILYENRLIQESQAVAEMFAASAWGILQTFPESKPRQQMMALLANTAEREA